MKNNKIALTITGLGLVVLIGGYATYDYFAGNHVEIQAVIPAAAQSTTSGAEIQTGIWNIQQPSNVYFSVTTSKETVNFSMNSVKGSWLLDFKDPAKMTGEGIVDLTTMSSGNPQRDGHIKGEQYLQVATNPQSTFKVTKFESISKPWKEGEVTPVKITGTLTVKGISKEVTFASEALYS